jgi:hypothetical protein
MNVKISQEKLEKLNNIIYKIVDRSIDLDNLNMTNPYSYDMDTHEEYEDPYVEMYYLGDWLGEDDSEIVFTYYYPEYYSDEPSSSSHKEESPILEINYEHLFDLLEPFGHKLYSPVLSKWFEDKFNLPVKSVSIYF